MAELARLEAEPPPELPAIYRQQPIYYITNRFSVKGTNTTVKWPRYSKVMDYELEFGIITKGRRANILVSHRLRPNCLRSILTTMLSILWSSMSSNTSCRRSARAGL